MTKKTHGGTGDKEFNTWVLMRQRCTNPRNRSYHRYGGRGITVCSDWLHDYDAFISDMGPAPTQTHSIERIDNDGPYSPENCRWATPQEQANNRRSSRLIKFQGRTQTAADWAREFNIPYKTFHYRIQNEWSLEEALTTPVKQDSALTLNGKTQTMHEWAREYAIHPMTLKYRLKIGMALEDALTKERKPVEHDVSTGRFKPLLA